MPPLRRIPLGPHPSRPTYHGRVASWRRNAEDPRSTDELFRTALAELDLPDEELPATAAVVALQFRPTREVLDRAISLCRAEDPDERRLGVIVLGELRDLADVAAARPAFVDESLEALLALGSAETDLEVVAEVARALGHRQDPRALATLLGWRSHPLQRVRFFVTCSLPRCLGEEAVDRVVPALVELTRDESGAIRDYALFGLCELEVDTPEVRAAMLARVDDRDESAARQAREGLAAFDRA